MVKENNDYRRLIWGRSSEQQPTAPLIDPPLVVLAILAAVAPTTWFLPRDLGYVVSLSALLFVVLYAVVLRYIRLRTDPFFLVLVGVTGGLIAHYSLYPPNTALLQYIVITPLAVFATIFIFPRRVQGGSQPFAMGLTGASVIVSLVGIWCPWWTTRGDPMAL